MARATTRVWISFVVSLALAPVLVGMVGTDARAQARLSRAHLSLNNAIDCERRGDYELAATFFQQAQTGQDDLTPAERQELTNGLLRVQNALKSRQEGAEQLRKAEEAVKAGQVQEANNLLREVSANQFLTTADKQKAQQLTEKLRPNSAAIKSQPALPESGSARLVQARVKVQQARALVTKGNLDAAEAMAREAEAMNANYLPSEDTPRKIIDDVVRLRVAKKPDAKTPSVASTTAPTTAPVTKQDAKGLLAAARSALEHNEFDHAELLAHEAEKADSRWSLHLFGDSPSKVLKDVQTARAKHDIDAAASKTVKKPATAGEKDKSVAGATLPLPGLPGEKPKTDNKSMTPPSSAVASKPQDGPTGSSALVANKPPSSSGSANGPTTTATKPQGPAPLTTTPFNVVKNTEEARKLLEQGKKALQDKEYKRAKELADQAKSLKPILDWWEYTPEKLLADIQRASPQTINAAVVANGPKTSTPDAAKATESSDPRVLLKQARDLYAAGKLDEAKEVAIKANGCAGARWGLFDDSPDKLMTDIQKARAKRDQEESVKVLAEARKLLEQGNLDEAEKKACRAERLHGPYSVWDMGDRPQKLLAEVETARTKSHKTKLPPAPATMVAQNKDQKPAPNATPTATAATPKPAPQVASTPAPPPPSWPKPETPAPVNDAQTAQARQLLQQARLCLKCGDSARATTLANQVKDMNVTLDRPGDDTPAAVIRDVQLASVANLPPSPVAPATPATPAAPVDVNMQPAKQLLADARQLQKEGKLSEARAKVLEAQKLNVTYAVDEETPDRVLLELASLCKQRVESLVQQAGDYAATAQQDAARFQKAEADLNQARELAKTFGLDAQPIEVKMAWVKQQQTSGAAPVVADVPLPQPISPTAGVATINQEEDTPQQRGLALLDKARLELRRGETGTARRLTEEVFAGPYGVQSEAASVLRSIDVEEFNQKILVARRSFDAALSAFLRKEYGQARTILTAIDPRMLPPEKQAKMKELMGTPEMQPTALAQATEKPTMGLVPVPTIPTVPVVPLPAASKSEVVVAKNTPAGENYANQVQAMQEIEFQKFREEGLAAQREATERFQARETDRALDLLHDHLEKLESSKLDREKVAMLRRPIEDRLQKLQMLKSQQEFEEIQRGQKDVVSRTQLHHALAEKQKNDQVAGLMKQFNNLMKEGKYREAGYAAAKAHELDPDNVAADAAMHISEIQRNLTTAREGKKNREDLFVTSLNAAEDEGPAVDDKDPLKYDKKFFDERVKNRDGSKYITSHLKSDKERKIERSLDQPMNLQFKDTPLKDVIDTIREQTGINVVPDMPALDEENVSLDRPVTMNLEGVSMKCALNLLLRQVKLTYVINNEVLNITTDKHARGKLVQRTWPVADLVIPVDNHLVADVANLQRVLDRNNQPNVQMGGTQPFQPRNGLQNGVPVNSGSSNPDSLRDSPGWTAQNSTTPLASTRSPGQAHTIEDQLIKLITNTVAPTSWSDVGGPGTIDYFPLGMALVINQTLDVQEQVQELLDALRRLQDLQISVEVRMISLAEAFFERIGMDFNINLKTDRTTFEPQIVSQQFAPAGFVNDFSPKNFLTGLTPAGNFTSNLDIPISNSSFGMAIPPFGGYPNIPGADGGLSMGLAFLSDIQVFMFMEAAQGDRRTNVMQAPKLTLFNGQTSTIQIQDFQFFASNVQVVQVGGQVIFIPQNQPTPLGINLAIQGVVSADRRFVRLNIAPTMSNLATATVPLFPITTFITPVFDGGAQGQPIPFTQFIQQPAFTLVAIETTVSVPDGGTVLLGGLKLLNEGRNEFGPPILSKLPYIDRLFKNVGYGRDTSSLLIMVTPRVIINLEEEERQTGVITVPTPAL